MPSAVTFGWHPGRAPSAPTVHHRQLPRDPLSSFRGMKWDLAGEEAVHTLTFCYLAGHRQDLELKWTRILILWASYATLAWQEKLSIILRDLGLEDGGTELRLPHLLHPREKVHKTRGCYPPAVPLAHLKAFGVFWANLPAPACKLVLLKTESKARRQLQTQLFPTLEVQV